MRRCVQSRYLHLHIYVYSVLATPGHPAVQLSSPVSLSSSLLDDNLFLSSSFPSYSSLPTSPLPRLSPIHPKSRRSHATGRVLIHIITSFEKYNTAFHFWGDTATYQCLRAQ